MDWQRGPAATKYWSSKLLLERRTMHIAVSVDRSRCVLTLEVSRQSSAIRHCSCYMQHVNVSFVKCPHGCRVAVLYSEVLLFAVVVVVVVLVVTCGCCDVLVDSSPRYSSGKRYSDDDQYGADRKRRQGFYQNYSVLCLTGHPSHSVGWVVCAL